MFYHNDPTQIIKTLNMIPIEQWNPYLKRCNLVQTVTLISQLLKILGEKSPQLSLPHDNGGGVNDKSIKYYAKTARREFVRPSSTRLRSAVMSVTTPLLLDGVKDRYGPDKPTGRPIKI